MLRVAIERLQPGMVLARPIPHPDEPRQRFFHRGMELTCDTIAHLAKVGAQEAWIRHHQLEFLEQVIDEHVADCQRDIYAQVRRHFESVMDGASANVDLQHFEESLSDLFAAVNESHNGPVLLTKLDAFDNYLLAHSANVCYLAMMLGNKLRDYLADQTSWSMLNIASVLKLLGLGCILHDVGKMHIPSEILHKPEKLTAAEMEVMRLHPELGFEMVDGRIAPAAADIVLNHHQRHDGNGYPSFSIRRTVRSIGPQSGESISILCRIATVCDVYDAATARRCYSREKPPYRVLHEMRSSCGGFFDPVVLQAFLEMIPPFPIGKQVELNDGRAAVVVDFSPQTPYRPKVQLLGSDSECSSTHDNEIDLAETDQISIARVDGVDVQPFVPELDPCVPKELLTAV